VHDRDVPLPESQGKGPVASADAAVTVVACGPRERAEQSKLYAACFKKPLPERGLEWRYDEVPHGPSVSFVAREAGGATISGYACNPRLAVSRGEDSSAAVVGETGDVMTHPEWRKRGYFSGLDRAAMTAAKERGWAFAFGLPNRRSAHIFLELGWRRIGTVRPWTFVLRADAAARAWRRREGLWKAFGTAWLARAGQNARGGMRGELAKLRVEELREFPVEVDALARTVEARFDFMLRRTKSYLDWRFCRAPSRFHRALALRTPEGALRGYVVVQLPRPAQPVGYLIDVLGADDAVVAAAIEAGLEALEREGASVVEATAIDGSWWCSQLQRLGFGAPRAENHLTVIQQPLQPDHPLTRAAADASKWYFTDGDRDDETMG
jgi:GNAT superfamily N-acetyltransferase